MENSQKSKQLTRTKVEFASLPDAPYDLNDKEADVWRTVMSSVPADWFNSANSQLLSQMCKHIVSSQKVDLLIAAEERKREMDVQKYARLLRLRTMESRTINTLMRSMRLSQKSVYLPKTASNKAQGVMAQSKDMTLVPWNDDGESGDE